MRSIFDLPSEKSCVHYLRALPVDTRLKSYRQHAPTVTEHDLPFSSIQCSLVARILQCPVELLASYITLLDAETYKNCEVVFANVKQSAAFYGMKKDCMPSFTRHTRLCAFVRNPEIANGWELIPMTVQELMQVFGFNAYGILLNSRV